MVSPTLSIIVLQCCKTVSTSVYINVLSIQICTGAMTYTKFDMHVYKSYRHSRCRDFSGLPND